MEKPWLRFYETGVGASLRYPEQPLYQFLIDSASRYPHQTALLFYGKEIPYQELDDLSNRFANALRQFGVQKGDRVAIMLPNSPQSVIGFYGALKAGAVVVQFNPLYVEREIEFQLIDSGAKTMLALDLFYSKIRNVMDRTPLKQIFLTSVPDYLPPLLRLLYPLKAKREGQWIKVDKKPPLYDFVSQLKKADPRPFTPDFKPDDTALFQYTGGTTGQPKGAMLTHRNLVCNAIQSATWTGMREKSEVVLSVIPFFHSYGLTACLNSTIYRAGTLVLLPRFETRTVLKSIQKYRPTLFPGIQAMYVAINNFRGVDRYDLSSIRACISGAGPLHLEVQERFEGITGGKIVEGYGLTEASPVTHANPIRGKRKKGSIGLPFPDTDSKIVDLETGERELPVGETGELVIRGPQVMKGYWNRSEKENGEMLRNDWLYTGDIARMDEDGFFYIVDRKKDMIKTKGENVYPREVEEVLYRHPKVKDAVVAGIPESFSVEAIKAYVVLKEAEQATEEEILEFCRRELARFKVPKYVEFRKDLPKTIVGKVLRRILIEEEKKKAKG
ncbi:MAG: long-chain-fatty-acid--CoA ligase [Nitrospiria bacterium]